MTSPKKTIHKLISEALVSAGEGHVMKFSVTYIENAQFGDFATNVAMVGAKDKGISPQEYASPIVEILKQQTEIFSSVEVAGPGFINMRLSEVWLKNALTEKSERTLHKDKQALIEYTDPNCFKQFHIGHLMSNTIGESIARLYEEVGYKVMRVCYPSDIGLNVAKGVWGVMQLRKEAPSKEASLKERVEFLGRAYAYAHSKYEESDIDKQAIIEINKKIYEGSDEEIMVVYKEGRDMSLRYFETLYSRLGTAFDAFVYESEVGTRGKEIVLSHIGNIFEQSDGAIVWKGEQEGLHTRVFVTSLGIPTYEAKDLGNYEAKLGLISNAHSYVTITANEQNEYFKVINAVATKVFPHVTGKLTHIGHGMLRLPEGKMSSRTGNVIGAEDLLSHIEEKITDRLSLGEAKKSISKEVLQDIANAAIKFSILRQSPGKDIIFDIETSISFEGDSGPYLQYTHARITQLLARAREEGIVPSWDNASTQEHGLEVLLASYDDIVELAFSVLGPHLILEHLVLIAREYNSLYGRVTFVDKNSDQSPYYLALSQKVQEIVKRGLHVLSIAAPEKM